MGNSMCFRFFFLGDRIYVFRDIIFLMGIEVMCFQIFSFDGDRGYVFPDIIFLMGIEVMCFEILSF